MKPLIFHRATPPGSKPRLDAGRGVYTALVAAFSALSVVFAVCAVVAFDDDDVVRTRSGTAAATHTVGDSEDEAAVPEDAAADVAGAAVGSGATGGATSGSKPETQGGPSTRATGEAGVATNGEIVLGSVVSASGPVNFSQTAQTARAFWAKVNDAGGINGRRVRFILYDDGLDPNRSFVAFRRLVEADKVVAIVNSLAPLGEPRAIPYLTQKRVPLIPGSGVTGFDSPVVWFLESGTQRWGTSYCKEALRQGLQRVYFLYVETELVHPILQAFRNCFEAGKGRIVGEEQVPIGQPDYTATALNLRRTQAEAVFAQLGTGADILNLWRAIDRQSVPVRTLGRQGSDIDAVRDYTGPAGKGYTIRSTVLPPHAGGAAIREIRAALDRYVPGTELQTGNVANWVGGLLAYECLGRISGEITREAIIAEMDRTTNFSAKGLTQPITYRSGQHLGPKVFFFQKQGTAWGPVHVE